jgi:hypothetical protein
MKLHGSVSMTLPAQRRPSPFEGAMTIRVRILSPPPQLVEQSLHSDHCENSQSTSGSASLQPSACSSGRLHGVSWARAPAQGLPPSVAFA